MPTRSFVRSIRAKDVDGFHPVNVGKLLIGERDGFVPCTPAGIQEMLRAYRSIDTPGAECVIVGRSNIVGKPMAALLMQDAAGREWHRHGMSSSHARPRGAHATRGHPDRRGGTSRSRHRRTWCVRRSRHRRRNESHPMMPAVPRRYRLVGDVDFATVREVASKITPVPGGVGPMTIAMLMANTVRAAERFAVA